MSVSFMLQNPRNTGAGRPSGAPEARAYPWMNDGPGYPIMFQGTRKAQQYLEASPGARLRLEEGELQFARRPCAPLRKGRNAGAQAPTDDCFILSERRNSGGTSGASSRPR